MKYAMVGNLSLFLAVSNWRNLLNLSQGWPSVALVRQKHYPSFFVSLFLCFFLCFFLSSPVIIFSFLITGRDRTNYLLVKEAKIIAMTCTHAALKRRDLVELGFKASCGSGLLMPL